MSTADVSLLVSARIAAAMVGKSLRTWQSWDAAGRVPQSIIIGRSRSWRVAELKAWIAAGCPERSIWNAIREKWIPT